MDCIAVDLPGDTSVLQTLSTSSSIEWRSTVDLFVSGARIDFLGFGGYCLFSSSLMAFSEIYLKMRCDEMVVSIDFLILEGGLIEILGVGAS